MARRRKRLDSFGASDEDHAHTAKSAMRLEIGEWERMLESARAGDCFGAAGGNAGASFAAGSAVAHIDSIENEALREQFHAARKGYRELQDAAVNTFQKKCFKRPSGGRTALNDYEED